jgi:hypothetical protein
MVTAERSRQRFICRKNRPDRECRSKFRRSRKLCVYAHSGHCNTRGMAKGNRRPRPATSFRQIHRRWSNRRAVHHTPASQPHSQELSTSRPDRSDGETTTPPETAAVEAALLSVPTVVRTGTYRKVNRRQPPSPNTVPDA